MKTKIKQLFIALILFFAASFAKVSAQSTYQDQVTEVQFQIMDLQNIIADPNTDPAKVSAAQIVLNDLQFLLPQLQAKSAIELQELALQQQEAQAIAARQVAEQSQQLTNSQGESVSNAISQLSPQKQAAIAAPLKLTVDPNPNYPNMIPLFQSTGDPQQDAQIIRNWLANNPYIRR